MSVDSLKVGGREIALEKEGSKVNVSFAFCDLKIYSKHVGEQMEKPKIDNDFYLAKVRDCQLIFKIKFELI